MEMNFFDGKRSIVCALSMVALLSVALGHTVPDSSVETFPESLVGFVDKPVKKSDVISKDLGLPWSLPPKVGYCKVDVGSFGYDDSRKCSYVRTSGGSSEVIPKPNELTRGIILFELDPIRCTSTTRQQFDTWGFEADKLVHAMYSASPGTIFIGVSVDTAEAENYSFRKSANWFFTKYKMNLYEVGLGFRDKFVFMMRNGYPNKTIYHSSRRGGNCLEKSFVLKVTYDFDARFF